MCRILFQAEWASRNYEWEHLRLIWWCRAARKRGTRCDIDKGK